MSSDRLFLLNPYDDNHLKKIIIFEDENKMADKPSAHIKYLRENISEFDYFDPNKNDFEEILFTEKAGKITDCCYINGERDLKQCAITPLNINNKNKRRYLPELAATYALDTLNMEEAFVKVDVNDDNMINYLEMQGLKNIGEVGNNIILAKDKEEKENSRRMIS